MVLLAECNALKKSKTACSQVRRLPSPPLFPGFPGVLPKPIGRTAHFLPGQNAVLVSYLHHGIVSVLSTFIVLVIGEFISSLQMLGSEVTGGCLEDCSEEFPNVTSAQLKSVLFSALSSGRSSVSFDKQTIAVTNLYDGIDYYSLSDQSFVNSVGVDIIDNHPTSVVFDQHGLVAFGGSSGAVQVANLSPPPRIVQVLDVGGAFPDTVFV